MYLSIVIPVYNEQECIRSSYDRIVNAIKNSSLAQKNVELIFINDGSADQTPAILNSFKSDTTDLLKVNVLHFSRNFGHSAAVFAGIEAAEGELIGIIDADMQDPPELIPKMVEKIHEGFDVVYGLRSSREGETLSKKFTAWAFYRVINILASIDIPKDTGDFRVMTRQVVEALLSCHDQAPFVRGLVAWVGFKQYPMAYAREERKLGTTKYPLKKMIKFAWNAISSFSNSPLLLITYLGIGMLGVSLLITVWALYQYSKGEVIQGWTSLLVGFTLGNSVTLIMLGIIGLYLGKVIDQVRGRPRYIVRK